MLRADSESGGRLNNSHLSRGESAPLADGDRFSPHSRAQGGAVEVRFEAHHGVVHTVQMTAR